MDFTIYNFVNNLYNKEKEINLIYTIKTIIILFIFLIIFLYYLSVIKKHLQIIFSFPEHIIEEKNLLDERNEKVI